MKNEETSGQTTSGEIVDLATFRKQKETSHELGRGRKPLYVSHLTGKITGKQDARAESPDFGDRLSRIRTSLEKINRLMDELKTMSKQDERLLEEKRGSSSRSI